jgi:hypothetical protein
MRVVAAGIWYKSPVISVNNGKKWTKIGVIDIIVLKCWKMILDNDKK